MKVFSVRWMILALICLLCSCQARHAELSPAIPSFWGLPDAPRTLIVYTNPECQPCRQSWPELARLLQSERPEGLRVLVLGRGFSTEGTQLLFVASLVAEQDADTAFALLDAIMTDSQALVATVPWLKAWLSAHDEALEFSCLVQDAASEVKARAYMEAVDRVTHTYALRYTPSFILDGVLLEALPETLRAFQH